MELFVFPLGHTVFYPSISKPFNIFEPRYVQMVRDAIAQNKSIAIGYVDEPGQAYQFFPGQKLNFVREVVGFGSPIILEERTDGGMTIFLQGQGKARLGPVLDVAVPYIVCQADLIPENLLVESESIKDLNLIHKVFLKWVNTNVQEKRNRDQFTELVHSPHEVLGCFVSYMIEDQDLQQMILEESDINQKISLIKSIIMSGETNT